MDLSEVDILEVDLFKVDPSIALLSIDTMPSQE